MKQFFLLSLLTIPVFGINVSTFAGFFKKQEIPEDQKLPIVFHPKYDIGLLGLENLHPFDSKKYGKVAQYLIAAVPGISSQHFHKPQHEVTQVDLLKVHTHKYLQDLYSSKLVASITEVLPLAVIPNFLLQWKLLTPMRLATQGTIDAAFLALKKGVGINLGGGYHHAKCDCGGGFCVYADVPLAINKLREKNPDLKVLLVDLDAHQGNGNESCLKHDKKTYIVDCYNEHNYPGDIFEAGRIDKRLTSQVIYCDAHKNRGRGPGHSCADCNQHYLVVVDAAVKEAIAQFKPDILFYNAGTDCFEEDPIGAMALTKQGIIDRDEIVFAHAKNNNVPICMTLSGGYSKKSADIIGSSLVNLYHKKLLQRDNA